MKFCNSVSVVICFILSISLLTACGGGDGVSTTPNQEIKVGQFIDGAKPASGLYYETASKSGVTSPSGEFEYLEGETVTFFLGKLTLPPISASSTINLSSYVPEAVDASNPHLANLTRLFQSLDTDFDYSNGIQLPSSFSVNINSNSTEPLVFNMRVDQFEVWPQITEIIQNYNIVLIDIDVAIANYQIFLDEQLAELLAAALNEGGSPTGMNCIDSRTHLDVVSPYPCIPGTGGFAVGDISVKTVISPQINLPTTGARNDFIWANNDYINDMHKLADIFDDTYIINDFARDLNVGIINFVTTDPNPETDPTVGNGSWNHTELKLDGAYIGSLPYSDQSKIAEIRNRCGLRNNTRQIILPPGTYQWSAKAYRDYNCARGVKLFCTDEYIEYVKDPIWNWNGQVEVRAGECTVVNALGSSNSAPTAINVSIIDDNGGDALVGDNLTGQYTYDDDGDIEGTMTFRWLRDGIEINGITGLSYTLVTADNGANITFEVTPIAITGNQIGTAVLSSGIVVSNGPSTFIFPIQSGTYKGDGVFGSDWLVLEETLNPNKYITRYYKNNINCVDEDGSTVDDYLGDGTVSETNYYFDGSFDTNIYTVQDFEAVLTDNFNKYYTLTSEMLPSICTP